MLDKKNFFKNSFFNSGKFKRNFKKTKFFFNELKEEIKSNNIPMLQSYNKNYNFDFTSQTVAKFLKYKNIIIIGMGGSILGTKSIYSFFKYKIKKNVFFLDNLDPDLYYNLKKIKNLKDSCFIIVSKSGDTLETIVNFGLIFSKSLLKNKLIIITEIKDSILMSIANQFNAEVIEHKNFISGRYSVFSEVGMFPAALMELDIFKFQNLHSLVSNKKFVYSLIKNVASIYTSYQLGIRNSVILNYDSNLKDLCFWYQQLVGESLGKGKSGITPIISECPKDHHSLMQLYLDGPRDKFFTFLSFRNKNTKNKVSNEIVKKSAKFLKNKSLNSIIEAQCTAVKNIFDLEKIPYRSLVFKSRDERELSNIISFFVLEILLLSRLMQVNPFDQPAVEKIKVETKKILLK